MEYSFELIRRGRQTALFVKLDCTALEQSFIEENRLLDFILFEREPGPSLGRALTGRLRKVTLAASNDKARRKQQEGWQRARSETVTIRSVLRGQLLPLDEFAAIEAELIIEQALVRFAETTRLALERRDKGGRVRHV